MNPTTTSAHAPALRTALLDLLHAHRPAFGQQRVFDRMTTLFVGMLWALARHTITQCLLVLGLHDRDWSAFYRLFSRDRIPIDACSALLLSQILTHVPPDQPLMLAVDAFHIPRTSRRMPGVGWAKAPRTAPFRPGLAPAQRFGAIHWLPPLAQGWTRAIPLASYALFTPKARPAAEPPQREWEGALHALQTLRSALDAAGRRDQRILLLADGSYDVVELWKALPHDTRLIARSARNRHLRHLPPPYAGRGRRRTYGDQAPAPKDWFGQRRGWHTTEQDVRGHLRRMRYRVEGPYLREGVAEHPLWLVIMGGQIYQRHGRRKHREPVPVLVSAVADGRGGWQLPLAQEALLVWLWQRWEVEVAHRELKSGFGLGEQQSWHRLGTIRSVQWVVWSYAVCLLAAYRTWGICGGPQPPGRWRKRAGRWSFSTLWRVLRLAVAEEFQPGCGGMPDNRAEMAGLTGVFAHMVHGSTRL